MLAFPAGGMGSQLPLGSAHTPHTPHPVTPWCTRPSAGSAGVTRCPSHQARPSGRREWAVGLLTSNLVHPWQVCSSNVPRGHGGAICAVAVGPGCKNKFAAGTLQPVPLPCSHPFRSIPCLLGASYPGFPTPSSGPSPTEAPVPSTLQASYGPNG